MKFTLKGRLLLTIAILGFLNSPQASAQGTGGTVTVSGAYTIHTFTTSGTFTLSSAANLDVVIVAGGGGGGHQHAGGAGGGGVLTVGGLGGTAQSYAITVGGGGAGCTWYPYTGNNGGNSVAFGYTAIGGGAGTGMPKAGNSGGSGGADGYPSGGVQGGAGTSGQGNSGNTAATGSIFNGGGGGGAGGPGNGINGGAPLSTWAGTFAGGGGGGYGGGAGGGAGAGAGGAGAAYGNAAAANTGSGGGGGGNMDAFGGNGGSGIVIIRYLTPAAANPTSTNTSSLGSSMLFGQTSNITTAWTCDTAHGDAVLYSLMASNLNVPGATYWNNGVYQYYSSLNFSGVNPLSYSFQPTALGTYVFNGLCYTNQNQSGWSNWGPGVTVTVVKATPTGTFTGRNFTPSGNSYTVLAADLNAAFTNPYSGSVAAPTGAVTYSIVGLGTAVAASTQLTAGASYIIRASCAGDTNYNATSKDASWTVAAPPDTTPPTVPTGLAAVNVSATGCLLYWTGATDNVGVTTYEVFKGGVSVGTVSTTSKALSGLSAGTAYALTVRAGDAAGNWSAQSAPFILTTSAGPLPDSDGDGIPNAIESQLGTDPNAANAPAPAALLKITKPH